MGNCLSYFLRVFSRSELQNNTNNGITQTELSSSREIHQKNSVTQTSTSANGDTASHAQHVPQSHESNLCTKEELLSSLASLNAKISELEKFNQFLISNNSNSFKSRIDDLRESLRNYKFQVMLNRDDINRNESQITDNSFRLIEESEESENKEEAFEEELKLSLEDLQLLIIDSVSDLREEIMTEISKIEKKNFMWRCIYGICFTVIILFLFWDKKTTRQEVKSVMSEQKMITEVQQMTDDKLKQMEHQKTIDDMNNAVFKVLCGIVQGAFGVRMMMFNDD